MIEIQVKYDRSSRWHKLSVGLHDLCPMDTIAKAVADHASQYAIDNQLNPHMVAGMALDNQGKLIYYRESNATANQPTRN